MNKAIKDIKDCGLVPLRIDNNTVLFVTPDKANGKHKDQYLKNIDRARKLALNLK